MKTFLRFLAITAAFSAITTATAASASTVPVAYNTEGTGPWNHPAVRPGRILAPGYAPWGVRHMSWSTWKSAAAGGRGQAFGYFTSENHIDTYSAHVRLYDVQTRGGVRYFAKMEISAAGHTTKWLRMQGGTWSG